jgi:hypothetical protein
MNGYGGGTWDRGETLADRFRANARDSKNLYGYAMRGMAEDWEAGGPTWVVCQGYENAPLGAMIQLRLLAGVFRLVLTGKAQRLVEFYPCLGGNAAASDVWPVMRNVIDAYAAELHDALAVTPQTNEVGRSAPLLAGLFDLVAACGVRRIRLLEVGASAGLNLLLDQYAFHGDSWQFGHANSMVQLAHAIDGQVRPEPFTVVERAGCDLSPVDAATAQGRLLLTSFVWPFDVDRHRRLAGALEIAASHPVRVDKAPASEWLPGATAPVEPETLTVVWHSITQMYWDAEELAAVEAILQRAGAQQLLGEVGLEFDLNDPEGAEPELRTRLWNRDADIPRQRLLGTAHYHGVPVRLAGS